ncbi:GntR family transcriptional regulator [Limibacterium fermenti]|jgi:DNA-binding transcriptional regulator YhcF (GntR family)|uniref:GntR family transcriptional regulator n=1 Tax=Limibacterium fermenti TaxID=3229863 RepID=UPI003AB9B4D8
MERAKMDIDFDHKGTKVQQLIDYLQLSISTNEYRVGDSLPSINYLKEKYEVSRDTVFKAFSELKTRKIIDSIPGKGYYVASNVKNVLLLLDEYTPFKEVLYNTLIAELGAAYKVDLWFHQFNEELFNEVVVNSVGKYNKYLIMNYHNEEFSNILTQIDKKKLLLLDFGKFDKNGYYYVCQDFDESFEQALESIKEDLSIYKKIVYVINKTHKHPRSSIACFSRFCTRNHFEWEVVDEIPKAFQVNENYFYIVIKQQDVVNIIKKARLDYLKSGRNYGLLAYNENPFYEIVEDGISSISIDWEEMGRIAADFVLHDTAVQTYLPTTIVKRNSF